MSRIVTSILQAPDRSLSSNSQLKSLYKKFYRLRHFIDEKPYNIDRYTQILRWKFSNEHYNTRLKVVLNRSPEPINDIIDRIYNTLVFVHNSTVILPKSPQKPYFYRDFKQHQRLEKLVILTMLKMHYEMPIDMKTDASFSWYQHAKSTFDEIPETPSKKQLKLIHPTHIGFADYEMTLMVLNETYKMCL